MVQNVLIDAPLGKSDHSVITFTVKCKREIPPPQIKTLYQKGDYKKMINIIDNSNWEDRFKEVPDDVEAQWAIFKEIYEKAEKECVPKKLVYINGNFSKKFSSPLDAKNLKKLKRKNRIWSKMRKNLATEEEKLEFKKLRNQIRRLTRKMAKAVQKSVADQAKTNPKLFWKYAQSKLKTRSGIPDLLIDKKKQQYTKNDKDKADTFSKQFSSVFTVEPDGDTMPDFDEQEYEQVLSSIEITTDMVEEKLKKLKVNKSPGPDRVHPRVLQEVASSITGMVTIIFSTSLKTKTLPSEWKHANVSAIYKKGNKSTALNYRPVSLTSILCKVLESIIRDHIVIHMRTNNLFSDKQFGFIGGRSTTLQLLHVLDLWCEILDQGGQLDIIYCDFMKAFDKVPHKRLIYKVSKYGIKGEVLGWIESFLANRTQCVVIGNEKSENSPVTSGIPQGSVLGPLLFVIYINDLPKHVSQNTLIFLFADDTKAFRQIKTPTDNDILQRDIDKLTQWSNTWLLKFHPDKCVSMSLGKSKNDYRYNMEGHPLKSSTCEKDLGVHIDDKLKFEHHIYEKIKKANRVLAVIRKTFTQLDVSIYRQVFKALVRPHLEYAQAVWSPHSKKLIKDIEDVQRRSSKMVPGLSNMEYPDRLRTLKMPTLAYRRARGDMIEVYKLLAESNGYDQTLPDLLTRHHRESHWSHSKQLYHKAFEHDILKYNFTRRILDIWNHLPGEVVNAVNGKGEPCLLAFEKALDRHWEDQELVYNFEASITWGRSSMY